MSTPFATGRRWFCDPKNGRARFWFVIIGPGTNHAGKPASGYKRCRIEIHPDDVHRHAHGYLGNGQESTYSHKHLKKHGVLEPEVAEPKCPTGYTTAAHTEQLCNCVSRGI